MRRELIRGVGRHSRKGPKPPGSGTGAAAANPGGEREGVRPGPGTGRRRRVADAPAGANGHAPFQQPGHVRGGHPEQREPGGGWGAGPQPRHREPGRYPAPPPRTAPPQQPPAGARPLIPGPRREFVEAFDAPPAPPASRGPVVPPARPADPYAPVGAWDERPPGDGADANANADTNADADAPEAARDDKGIRGRTFTGIAAAAVTTVLAVVVAGQVAQDHDGGNAVAQAPGVERDGTGDASRSDDRPTPTPAQAKPLSYEQKMARAYPLDPKLEASGKFETVPGTARAPGRGHKYRYRIDVEKGLGLDAGLFARAVQETLNDDRSWAHDGAMTFERVSSGKADFVLTLASPGTTAVWCDKSDLDITQENVSCDSAATERVMINAYRWAQGSSTFGPDKLFAYRQMLINHEVGHRLGHNHVSCRTPGALAPVMQQQTKTLDLDGIKCRPNAWVHPDS
ncbi:DUF3152 domain-containing protein [Streptomyces sp. ML-6]|uniref:DUF3152 domain-containing protein n=1 Tax=Streptomyces sp. ML-6 TaxID=2982693 RepID=UPI0024BF429D|nr:DUF3152 domain-containing protein [Streptomyces sp. ML-6]MDK0522048.1 DUF3152 domain-containing protein [Streptomyces sp. ML-6]